MDLSVVIVNWNSGEYLARLLASLEPLFAELKSVTVVDNASGDGSADCAASLSRVELERLPSNRGFAAAANQGIRESQSEFVLLLNPDIEIRPEPLRELYRRVEGMEKVAIACARLVDASGTSQETFQLRPLPTFWNIFADALFLDEPAKIVTRRRPPAGDDFGPEKAGRLVEQPAAACWLIRKAAWSELRGFDESFTPAWFEDVDFCKRLQSTDWEIRYFADLECIHRGGVSLNTLRYSEFIRVYYGNLLRYLKKHHPAWHVFLWLPVSAGSRIRMLLGRK